MQNKGFVKVFAVLLTLACAFYLSFSFVTRYQMNKAAEDPKGSAHYLDSMQNQKVWLGIYTLKQCREMEIGLGLDLKGGMNVILEVSVPDVVKALADNKPDEAFNKAVAEAAKLQINSQEDFITLFIREYKKLAPEGKLAELFATQQLKDKVNTRSTDAEVEKVLREEVSAAVDNSFNVLRTRIDRFGVAQPNIQTLEGKMGRIMVELPGIKEPERVRKLLQGSANLEFWETFEAKDIVPVLASADNRARGLLNADAPADSAKVEADTTAVAEASAVSAKDSLAAALKGETATASNTNIEELKKEHPLLAVLQLNQSGVGCIVGYADYKDTADVNRILNMKAVKEVMPRDLKLMWGVKASDMDKTGRIFELYAIKSTERNGRAPLEGDVVTDAKDEYDQFNKPCVSMSMNTEGSRRWAALTKKNIGREIAIVLDGYVYSAPRVNSEITGGNSQITGNFTPEVTKDLANVLKSGKMPAPARIVQEDIVGPSLGQESINQGIVSFIVALIVLMIYMCAMYGFIPGMVANGALFINFFFTLGILSSFQAALTMSGIAGMVLSLGMAVDANVLIYERTKEELRAGKGTKQALAEGYKNAFSAIFDSNLTSIITGIILFNFGTGPIRGFATTLIIGILCSFFSAVFLTRLVYEHFMNKDKWLNLTFTTGISKNLMQNVHYNFMGITKRSFTIWGVVIVVCIISFFVRGLAQSIDFTGGRNFVVQFEQVVQPETVRSLLQPKVGDANVQAIALGTDGKTIRVTTNYRINEDSPTIDAEIEEFLYNALKEGNLLGEGTTLEIFIDRDNRAGGSIISSQKVGPSIADDIKTSAVWSVVLALIAIGLYPKQ
jgi:SecD/SecF fusion protein